MTTNRTTSRTRTAGAVLGILLAGVVVAAPAADAATVKTVTMTSGLKFMPASVTVTRGTVVKWKNTSFFAHTTTSNTGLWNKTVLSGAAFSRTFTRAGTFKYHCNIHTGMTGTVVVK
jgi:plastocyanin